MRAESRSGVFRVALRHTTHTPDLVVLQPGPQHELMLPLVHRHRRGAEHQAALFHARGSGHAHQGLAGPTGEHDDA